MLFKNTSKVNKFRTFAMLLVFLGFIIMYIALLFKSHPIVMGLLMLLGFLSVILSSGVYLWVGMISTKAVKIICPNCGTPTKVLGRIDICTSCKEPLTLDPELANKPFDPKYNRKSFYNNTAGKQ